jgi:hypothetical protein
MSSNWVVEQNVIIDYIQSCKDFVENDDLFHDFKQDPRYTNVLEHVGKYESDLYISEMKSKELITESVLSSIKQNDIHGKPTICNYDEYGDVSPSTIRYMKNSLDILDYFGKDVEYNNILEIGGGYGGLCKVFSSFINFKKYYLVDLPEVSQLSKKYLSKFDSISNQISYMDTENIKSIKNLDLVISNYAFSECSEEYQKLYYNKLIKNSKKFYIIYNNFENNLDVNEFIDIASKDFSIHFEDEIRENHTNKILYGIKIK